MKQDLIKYLKAGDKRNIRQALLEMLNDKANAAVNAAANDIKKDIGRQINPTYRNLSESVANTKALQTLTSGEFRSEQDAKDALKKANFQPVAGKPNQYFAELQSGNRAFANLVKNSGQFKVELAG